MKNQQVTIKNNGFLSKPFICQLIGYLNYQDTKSLFQVNKKLRGMREEMGYWENQLNKLQLEDNYGYTRCEEGCNICETCSRCQICERCIMCETITQGNRCYYCEELTTCTTCSCQGCDNLHIPYGERCKICHRFGRYGHRIVYYRELIQKKDPKDILNIVEAIKCVSRYTHNCSEKDVGPIYTQTYMTMINRDNIEYTKQLAECLPYLVNIKNLSLMRYRFTAQENIPYSLFNSPMINLITLSIQHMEITQFPAKMFTNLPHLTVLYLDNNKIKHIPSNLFSGLNKLKRLFLRESGITTIAEGALSSLPKLKVLQLEENLLKTVSSNLLSSLENLKEISLSANKLESIPKDIFRNNPKLEIVDLSHNKITSLHEKIFRNIHRVTKLLLYHNQMADISKRIFDGLNQLEVLKFVPNKMGSLPSSIIKRLNDSVRID